MDGKPREQARRTPPFSVGPMIRMVASLVWAALKPALPWILVAVLGGLVTYCTPSIGAGARISHEAAALDAAGAKAKRLRKRRRRLQSWLDFEREGRKADSRSAADAMTEEADGVRYARLDQARRSSALHELTAERGREPHRNRNMPDRRLLDPDRLREAIG